MAEKIQDSKRPAGASIDNDWLVLANTKFNTHNVKSHRPNPHSVASGTKRVLRDLSAMLVDAAFDSGLDTIELISLLRNVSIRRAAKRQTTEGQRLSISRISVVTGISRQDISRALKVGSYKKQSAALRENLLTRVLNAWHTDPRFSERGRARPLKMFGRGGTFDALVKKYGRGIPTRAVLDELVHQRAVEMRPFQCVVPKESMAVPKFKQGEIDLRVESGVSSDGKLQRDCESRTPSKGTRRNFRRR